MQVLCGGDIQAKLGHHTLMLGTRAAAEPLREIVENALVSCPSPVCVDFAGAMVTNSFMDEFLGVLILRHGPEVLSKLVFRNCNDDVRAAVSFVSSIRANEFKARKTA